jgi:hypothetical protein
MHPKLSQLINTFNLEQDSKFNFCYNPISSYSHTGSLLFLDEESNIIHIAESISYAMDNNNPMILYCGNTIINLDTMDYTSIVQLIQDLLSDLRLKEQQIKQSLVNEQLELVKKDF